MPFLSLLDDRAKPKGSRDPLGFELVWSYFGRKVIGNLTTITSSMDNFAVALLGFYWANQIVPESTERDERHKFVRETFLRYEQLTGYVRCIGGANDILGITRVKVRVQDDGLQISLGMSADQQILSDQVSYGLWGLYSSALGSTGLISGSDRKVTSLGKNIAQGIIRQLGDISDELFALITGTGRLDRNQLKSIADDFLRAIRHESVQLPLLDALMSGKDAEGIQKELWTITKKIFASDEQHPETVAKLVDLVLASGPSELLVRRLRNIMEVERLLVAANNIFHYCRRKDGKRISEILSSVDGRYSYQHLLEALPEDNFPRRDFLAAILAALKDADDNRTLIEIFNLNKDVMKHRNGAPWVEVETGTTLRVKMTSETAQLASQQDLEERWDYDYFLGSFLTIARRHFGQA